jgi:hypothetical protein
MSNAQADHRLREKPPNPQAVPGRRNRVLDPAERIAEVLFGLIMVLTFTGSLSIATAGREDIRAMLIAALGCNIAWGVIDGVLYVMASLAERGNQLATFRNVRQATTAADAHRLIADSLPPFVASVLSADEIESVRARLLASPAPAENVRVTSADGRGALAVFLLVFLSTFPVALPFLVMQDGRAALRASNAVAIAMLFVAGVAYARIVGRSAWVFGASMVILGCVLVALTMALGG